MKDKKNTTHRKTDASKNLNERELVRAQNDTFRSELYDKKPPPPPKPCL
jgi:hypothetical protein